MSNSYLARRERKANGDHGNRSEKRLASKLGGRRQPGSGSLKGAKGDFKTADFLVESKSTVNASLGLKQDWLAKIEKEALDLGKTPALTLSFVDGSGSPTGGEWVVIPLWKFQELCNS